MTDLDPTCQQSPRNLVRADALPDATPRLDTPPRVADVAETLSEVAVVADVTGMLSDVTNQADALPAGSSEVPDASDPSPPQDSREAPPAQGSGLTAHEKLRILPPANEHQSYEPMEVTVADIIDYLLGDNPPRHDR